MSAGSLARIHLYSNAVIFSEIQGYKVGIVVNILSFYQFDMHTVSDLSNLDFFLQKNVVIHVSYLQELGNVYPGIPDSFDFLQ